MSSIIHDSESLTLLMKNQSSTNKQVAYIIYNQSARKFSEVTIKLMIF